MLTNDLMIIVIGGLFSNRLNWKSKTWLLKIKFYPETFFKYMSAKSNLKKN